MESTIGENPSILTTDPSIEDIMNIETIDEDSRSETPNIRNGRTSVMSDGRDSTINSANEAVASTSQTVAIPTIANNHGKLYFFNYKNLKKNISPFIIKKRKTGSIVPTYNQFFKERCQSSIHSNSFKR